MLTDFINHGIVEQNQVVSSETIHATMTGDMLGKLMSLFFSEFCSQANKAAFQRIISTHFQVEGAEKPIPFDTIKKKMGDKYPHSNTSIKKLIPVLEGWLDELKEIQHPK